MPDKAPPAEWRDWAADVLKAAGLPPPAAQSVAMGLVEGDLYGHSTHGLALLPGYVDELEAGTMEKQGEPDVVADAGAAVVWDARRLPGVWTTALAVEEAVRRAEQFGVGAVSIRRSHHIACLAAFLEQPARRGSVVLVLSSDPSGAFVAPFGGREAVMTPNPIAAGLPCEPDPIIVDVSTSITTAGMAARLRDSGERFPHDWLIDPDGRPTDDPAVMKSGGTILPIGGLEYGHKGYGLSLIVEALTQALGGFGRADGPTEWGASVLVLAFAPARLAGRDPFVRQTSWLAEACLRSAPIDPAAPVRLPGQAALARKREAARSGLGLPDVVLRRLGGLAAKMSLPLPVSRPLEGPR